MFKKYSAIIPVVFVAGSLFGLLLSFFSSFKDVGVARVVAQQGGVITRTVTLLAARDNTLYQSELGNLSNGAGEHFFVGQTQNGQPRRGLVAFDVAGAMPDGAKIVSATLSLNMSKTSGGQTAVSIHTVQQDWGEGSSNAAGEEGGGANASTGDATWLHPFFNSSSWSQPGGDFDEVPLATTMVGGNGRYEWSSAELTDAVLSWYTKPLDNFGLLLLGNEATVGTAKRFDTRENNLAANRPTLTILYTISEPIARQYLPIVLNNCALASVNCPNWLLAQ